MFLGGDYSQQFNRFFVNEHLIFRVFTLLFKMSSNFVLWLLEKLLKIGVFFHKSKMTHNYINVLPYSEI